MKPASIIVDPFLLAMIGTRCPTTAGELRRAIKECMNWLGKPDLERRVFLRKYTGTGDIRGLLDHVDDAVPVHATGHVPPLLPGKIVIGPLNDDAVAPSIQQMVDGGIPVFPVVHGLVSSKRCRGVMFPGNTPFSVYIPPGDFHCIPKIDAATAFEDRGVDTVMIKDEYGYHSGHVIPYIITPVSKLGTVLPSFARQCGRLYDPSGIVIDEFIGGIESTAIKVHVFGKVIPGEVMKYRVTLRGLDGVFKPSNDVDRGLLDDVDISTGMIDEKTTAMIDIAAARYFPLAMASVDMAIDRHGHPVVIDVNGRAGSFGEMQERSGSNDHNPFDFIAREVNAASLLSMAKKAADPDLDRDVDARTVIDAIYRARRDERVQRGTGDDAW
jgi:hypothetical protein